LTLRRLGAWDTQAVHALLQVPTFVAHYSRGLPTELGQVAQWMRAAQAPRWPVRRIEFAVFCNTSGHLVGLASLADVSVEDRRAEFLVGVNSSLNASSLQSWGIEAAALLLHYAFERLGLAKLTSLVFEDNPRALRSTIGLGFVTEGLLRDHVWDRAGQRYLSVHVQSILRTEYDQSPLLKRLRGRYLR
jgi:RimJ/RimL family protein N-acetyltransferase